MKLVPDSSICSLVHLQDFGEKIPQGHRRGCLYSEDLPWFTSKKQGIHLINDQIKNHDIVKNAPFRDLAFVQAYVISTQPETIKFFDWLGFDCVARDVEYPKYSHTISLYSMKPVEFIKLLEEKEKATDDK